LTIGPGQLEAGRPLLVAEHVSKRFGGLDAVKDVTFSVNAKEIVALVGSNGAGKSTLINLLSGAMRPDTGTVSFEQRNITRMPPHARARLGMVRTFQFPYLVEELTVGENIRIAIEARHRRNIGRMLGDVLAQSGLGRVEGVRVRDLPYGLRKLADCARAVASHPTLVLLDEPAAGLSAAELPVITAMVKWWGGLGTAFVIVEHNMDFVMPLAQRVTVMDYGEVIASGSPTEMMANQAVIDAYLGTMATADV
jgi:branched-chain amino acid transport system ATP-binding protein